MLERLNISEIQTEMPTIGMNVKMAQNKHISFIGWYVGGSDKIRALWRHYYAMTNSIIFVVDSTDRHRIEAAKSEIFKILAEDELKGFPLLVMCNKQDLPNSLSAAELTDMLDLAAIQGRQWYVQPCSAANGDGLCEGLYWLAQTLNVPRDCASAINRIQLSRPRTEQHHIED